MERKKSRHKLVPRKMLIEIFTTSNSFESNQMEMQTHNLGPLGWNVGHFYFSKIIDDPIARRARESRRGIKNASGFTTCNSNATQSDIHFFFTSVILSRAVFHRVFSPLFSSSICFFPSEFQSNTKLTILDSLPTFSLYSNFIGFVYIAHTNRKTLRM